MWLKNGDHIVYVLQNGGSVGSWVHKKHSILGPIRMVRVDGQLKKRGETHWCYPNFGTDRSGTLRGSKLRVERYSDRSVEFITPSLPTVEITVDEVGVGVALHIVNNGEQKMPILPAIHPYFSVPSKEGFSLITDRGFIAGFDLLSREKPLDGAVFEREYIKGIHLHGVGKVFIRPSCNCSHIVVWSDKPTDYVCIEPVFGKPGTYGKEGGRWLQPGEREDCRVFFRFIPD